MLGTELEVCALEELDFAVPCGHSQHGEEEWSGRHGGDATHVAVSYHTCPAVPDKPNPYYYPCCADWVAFVEFAHATDRKLTCPFCGLAGLWSDYAAIVGPL